MGNGHDRDLREFCCPALRSLDDRLRRVAPFAVGSGRGLLSDHIAGARSRRWQPLKLRPTAVTRGTSWDQLSWVVGGRCEALQNRPRL